MSKLSSQLFEFCYYDSSNILRTEYNYATKDLVVIFNKGKAYKYTNVSEQSYHELRDSESIGKTFSQTIKDKHPNSIGVSLDPISFKEIEKTREIIKENIEKENGRTPENN